MVLLVVSRTQKYWPVMCARVQHHNNIVAPHTVEGGGYVEN